MSLSKPSISMLSVFTVSSSRTALNSTTTSFKLSAVTLDTTSSSGCTITLTFAVNFVPAIIPSISCSPTSDVSTVGHVTETSPVSSLSKVTSTVLGRFAVSPTLTSTSSNSATSTIIASIRPLSLAKFASTFSKRTSF